MKKSLSILLATFTMIAMVISVVSGESSVASGVMPEIDTSTLYLDAFEEKSQEEPDCSPNCDTSTPADDYEDY